MIRLVSTLSKRGKRLKVPRTDEIPKDIWVYELPLGLWLEERLHDEEGNEVGDQNDEANRSHCPGKRNLVDQLPEDDGVDDGA